MSKQPDHQEFLKDVKRNTLNCAVKNVFEANRKYKEEHKRPKAIIINEDNSVKIIKDIGPCGKTIKGLVVILDEKDEEFIMAISPCCLKYRPICISQLRTARC